MDSFQKAERTGQWICKNQYVTSPEWEPMPYSDKDFDMNEDMNCGRFVRNYNISTKQTIHLSSNWLTGMAMYGLLALNDLTKKNEYVDSCLKAAVYLKNLQNTAEIHPGAQGAINERTSANRWCAPRDAVSAAWGFLRLYRSTGKLEFLKRTELFADWHMNYAFYNNEYPFSYYFFDIPKRDIAMASCQGGSALYYYDLFTLTGKKAYHETMCKISDYYMKHFINEDGSPTIIYDSVTGKSGDLVESQEWCDMHKYNDDFGMLALLATYAASGKKEYLDKAMKYINWVLAAQNQDGSFGKFTLSVSSCVCALNFMNIYFITKDKKFLDGAQKALKDLEKYIIVNPNDSRENGGVLGMNVCTKTEENNILCLRVSMYTIYTFMIFGIYEEFVKTDKLSELPASLKENPMFIGLKLMK